MGVVILRTASFALVHNVFTWLPVNGYGIKKSSGNYFSFNRKRKMKKKMFVPSRGPRMPLGLPALFAPGLMQATLAGSRPLASSCTVWQLADHVGTYEYFR
jgi:hypothetical protein